MIQLPWLAPENIQFPETNEALASPNGLLAAGGQLTPEWLLHAYSRGIFPWFSEGEPILWWSPSPRTIFNINQIHISKSLRKTLRKNIYRIRIDSAFTDVVNACAQSRPNQENHGTWISNEIVDAYSTLHKAGYAHSVEVWDNDELVGGLYGIALGRMFFGESMFSFEKNSSKIALFHLAEQLKEWHYVAIDCQVANDHLLSLGALQIPRTEFEGMLEQYVSNVPCHWNGDKNGYTLI
jgi:leucyl/phenylalanyl-tRNA---protein transferase